MLGDIGCHYNKIAKMADFLVFVYREVLQRTYSATIRENLVQANGIFAQVIHTGRIRLRKNREAKKVLKDILKAFLITPAKKGRRQFELSKAGMIQHVLLIIQCLESDVLTDNKVGKFFKQIIRLTEEMMTTNKYDDDPAFKNLFIGIVAEFSAVAIAKKPGPYLKLSKNKRINDIWWAAEPSFS